MSDLFSQALSQASYERVIFPLADASVDGGHRLVPHRAHGRRGADVEPTGQKEYTGSLSIPLYNDEALVRRYGVLYPDKAQELLELFERTPIGTLVHPSRGSFKIGLDTWRERLDPQRRNGITLEVTYVEHLGEASATVTAEPSGDPASQAASEAQAADTAMASADPTGALGWTPVASKVDEGLTFLEAAGRSPGEVDAAFREMLLPVESDLALFDAASSVATVQALEALRVSLYELRAAYLPLGAAGRHTVTAGASLWELALVLYGDALQAPRLAAANTIVDPLFVPPGTVLLVPPRG